MPRNRVKVPAMVTIAAATLVWMGPSGTAGAAAHQPARVVTSSGVLSDLSPSTADPTDGARAAALVVGSARTGSLAALRVRGLDRSAAGTRLGAHVHVGPCIPGDGAAAGPHYNSTGGTVVAPMTELWLDFTVRAGGSGSALARVPFVVPRGGAGSIVVHAMSTMPNGAAGARLACLPLEL